MTTLDPSIEHLLRELAPQVLAAISRRYNDFSSAEEAVQDAMMSAVTQWTANGIPDNPRGWLYHVAARRITDTVRSDQARRSREAQMVNDTDVTNGAAAPISDWPHLSPFAQELSSSDLETRHDDSLLLLFMCCHPALSSASAIALTLRAVGGLTTSEIANAFLVPETTMAQRISRAKATIKSSGISFEMPTPVERDARLQNVLHVLYLIFNEGYATTVGESVHRADVASEAIRLARVVYAALPNDGSVAGLLALMLLTDARRAARTGALGELIPLDEQDRRQWNRHAIDEGTALATEAFTLGAVGVYQLQAAIAALHDEAPHAADTDWPQIAALYTVMLSLSDNPMAKLSHAVAVAMTDGPAAGIALLTELEGDPRIHDHHRLHAVRGHLHEQLGDIPTAVSAFQRAAERTTSTPERHYLQRKIAGLQHHSD